MSIEDFIKFSKEEYGYDVAVKKDDSSDTFESIFGLSFKDDQEEIMIRAANKAEISSHQLMDAMIQSGLTGVYNLGMQHMLEYLKGDD